MSDVGAPTPPPVGVNVAGFLHVSNGLGDATRQLVASLRAAGLDVVEIDNDASDAPRLRPPRPAPDRRHEVTIAMVTSFEFEDFRARHPELFGDGRRVIGYWFWELADVPDTHRAAFGLVDEVWTPTTFVHDAFRRAAPPGLPVRLAPLRLPVVVSDPSAAAPWRRRWGDRFTFLTVFNYLSVPERKNPQAAIRAFRSAFGRRRRDVQLVVKAQNVEYRPTVAASLRRLAAGDDRIVFEEHHLDERSHHGLVEAADCLLSPHRSEGLGLVPALSMSLGTPVIATRYGGNVGYSTDDNGLLIGHRPVPVRHGEGVYPETGSWAEIDPEAFADALVRVEADRSLRRRLIAAGLDTIHHQPGDADFGGRYRELLADHSAGG